jgi:hypothetical protein
MALAADTIASHFCGMNSSPKSLNEELKLPASVPAWPPIIRVHDWPQIARVYMCEVSTCIGLPSMNANVGCMSHKDVNDKYNFHSKSAFASVCEDMTCAFRNPSYMDADVDIS